MPRTSVAFAFSVIVLGVPSIGAAQAVPPPAELRGAYAPGGDCAKLPRVVLTDVLTIHTGGAPARLAPLDACLSCAGGARYEGIEVWVAQLGPDQNPREPHFIFNAGEKRGVLTVDKTGMQSFPPAVRAVAMASPLKRCGK